MDLRSALVPIKELIPAVVPLSNRVAMHISIETRKLIFPFRRGSSQISSGCENRLDHSSLVLLRMHYFMYGRKYTLTNIWLPFIVLIAFQRSIDP